MWGACQIISTHYTNQNNDVVHVVRCMGNLIRPATDMIYCICASTHLNVFALLVGTDIVPSRSTECHGCCIISDLLLHSFINYDIGSN